MSEGVRKESPEKRWAKNDARGHFPHNTWLSKVLKKPAEQTRGEQYGPNGKDQLFSLHSITFL